LRSIAREAGEALWGIGALNALSVGSVKVVEGSAAYAIGTVFGAADALPLVTAHALAIEEVIAVFALQAKRGISGVAGIAVDIFAEEAICFGRHRIVLGEGVLASGAAAIGVASVAWRLAKYAIAVSADAIHICAEPTDVFSCAVVAVIDIAGEALGEIIAWTSFIAAECAYIIFIAIVAVGDIAGDAGISVG
jgi:hypothetical protein